MRDLLLFAAFAVIAPIVLVHPYVGALAWVLFGIWSPHRLTFGSAYEFPFSLAIAGLTLAGLLLTRDRRAFKHHPASYVLFLLMLWISVTTLFALTQPDANEMWWRVLKILGMTYVVIALINTRRQLELLVGVVAFSIAFYGIKGGAFTIITGGGGMVLGPNDTVLESNNHLGVANVMVIPLLAHFHQQAKKRWHRIALAGAMLLCAAAVLGSYSRGALLALGAMGAVLWLRSSYKVLTLGILVAVAVVLIPLMPDRWEDRMRTIETYQEDTSAMSRIYAWQMAWNIAIDRVTGGGFEYPSPAVVARYSPAQWVSVAHSIYFQALGEHGFIGLLLFALFWFLVMKQCATIRKRARGRAELRWAHSLSSMIQASMAGYAVGGAFINIAFWDVPYYLYAIVIVMDYVMRTEYAAAGQAKPTLAGVRQPAATPLRRPDAAPHGSP